MTCLLIPPDFFTFGTLLMFKAHMTRYQDDHISSVLLQWTAMLMDPPVSDYPTTKLLLTEVVLSAFLRFRQIVEAVKPDNTTPYVSINVNSRL